jgi:hypothetical protein
VIEYNNRPKLFPVSECSLSLLPLICMFLCILLGVYSLDAFYAFMYIADYFSFTFKHSVFHPTLCLLLIHHSYYLLQRTNTAPQTVDSEYQGDCHTAIVRLSYLRPSTDPYRVCALHSPSGVPRCHLAKSVSECQPCTAFVELPQPTYSLYNYYFYYYAVPWAS